MKKPIKAGVSLIALSLAGSLAGAALAQGVPNTANVTQTGTENIAGITQGDVGNIATITQTGSGQSAVVFQNQP
jgi:hypothetical protein